jgi:tetratricopeptide (TPR) repeat protein
VQHANTSQPNLAAEYAKKAFALRDRVTELERLRIAAFYFSFVTGEMDKQIEALELHKRTYPRDYRAPGSLSDAYLRIGQFDRAADAAREGLRLNPTAAASLINLFDAFVHSNRFPEAKAVFEQALQQKVDPSALRRGLYQVALVTGDRPAMKQQLDRAHGKPDEHLLLDSQSEAAAFAGQLSMSRSFSRRAIDAASGAGAKEVAAQYAAGAALRAAVFAACQQTNAYSAQALMLEPNTESLSGSALGLALCGDSGEAQSLADELAQRYPTFTLVSSLWLPVIRAAIELHRNNAAQAIELLEAGRRYEAAAEFWPQYLRGEAYMRQRASAQAADEFQKIIGNRGQGPLSPLYPLAHLGLARAAASLGDVAKARTAYQNLLVIWKDADPELPVQQTAR